MNDKKFIYYRLNRPQKNPSSIKLGLTTAKKSKKKEILLLIAISVLWVSFSLSTALSNPTVKTYLEQFLSRVDFLTSFFSASQNSPTKISPLKSATIQNAPLQKSQSKAKEEEIVAKDVERSEFISEKNANFETPETYIESTEGNNNFIKFSDIAELTDEKGVTTSENVNPLWQKEEDLKEMAFDHSSHRIEKNESIWLIAKRYGISIESIITANRLNAQKVHSLKAGELLKIPHFSGIFHAVKQGDSLLGLSNKYRVRLSEIMKYNDVPNHLSVGQTLFIPHSSFSEEERKNFFGTIFSTPVKVGILTSHYGMRFHPIKKKNLFHTGVDIGNNEGAKVFTIGEGKVVAVGNEKNYGNYAIVKHRFGYSSLYAHLDTIAVKENEKIKRGHKIGTVGNTGSSTGPHLHFELRKNNKLINPERFFNLKGSNFSKNTRLVTK